MTPKNRTLEGKNRTLEGEGVKNDPPKSDIINACSLIFILTTLSCLTLLVYIIYQTTSSISLLSVLVLHVSLFICFKFENSFR